MITRYGQEYDDADPMLGDYADLAQKGFGLFKKFGQGAKMVLKRIKAKVKAHKAKRKGLPAPVTATVKTTPTTTVYAPETPAELPIVVDHPQGLPKWVIPVAAVGAAYFLLTRRGARS